MMIAQEKILHENYVFETLTLFLCTIGSAALHLISFCVKICVAQYEESWRRKVGLPHFSAYIRGLFLQKHLELGSE
jgi:hypothetical protein